ncbi:MAG: hypothetical protein ACE5KH_05260 [Candidatus Geothermarchaeales archaeon]
MTSPSTYAAESAHLTGLQTKATNAALPPPIRIIDRYAIASTSAPTGRPGVTLPRVTMEMRTAAR